MLQKEIKDKKYYTAINHTIGKGYNKTKTNELFVFKIAAIKTN